MGAYDHIVRVIVPEVRFRSEELSPGVLLEQLFPGGKEGPNGEVHFDTPGGQTWTEYLLLGDTTDAFQMLIPDIRMPANQIWPLHWHDAWTVVLILEGGCVIGDWYMRAGDVFITEPSIEYGPLMIGPNGCRLLEIFAKAHLADGGYSPEYADHPTLQGSHKVFKERSSRNKRNDGHQMLSLENVEGITKTQLRSGAQWDLGDAGDPERGVIRDTRLSPGEAIERHCYGDWHLLMVLDGSMEVAGKTVEKDGYLKVAPNSLVDRLKAGAKGVHFLELARTATGADRCPVG